jgi:predicted Zn-dependent peptidase
MDVARRAGAVLIAGLLALAPACASAATGDLPNLGAGVTVGRLPSGGTYIVGPLAGAPVAAVELWYRAPSIGFGAKPQPSLARLTAQVVSASKPLIGVSLGTLVRNLGGRLSIAVYADSVSVAALVPANSARDVVKAMTVAFFAPVVSQDGFEQAQRDVVQEAALESFNPETLIRDAVFGELFAGGPQHYPPLGGPKDVGAITLADVRAFATRAFRSQNAVLVVSGAVEGDVSTSAASGRPAAAQQETAEVHATADLGPSGPGTAAKSFELPAGGYGWIGPRISDEREATALDFVSDYLFRPDAGVVSRQLADKYPDAFVVGQFITLYDPGVLFVAYAGGDIDAVRTQVDAGLKSMHTALPPDTFAAARRAFEYHLLSDLQTPGQVADNFGWYSIEGNPEYAPGAGGDGGRYFSAAESLTPDFVASVVEKYLSKAPAIVNLRPDKKVDAK